MSIKDQMPSREWMRQKIETDADMDTESRTTTIRLVAEEFASNLDTGEHWNALVEGFMAGASWANEAAAAHVMTVEEAIELGKSDNEANWDNPLRLVAYRIRRALSAQEDKL